MSERTTPKITEGVKDSYTKITFKPDLSRFHGMSMLDADTVAIMKRRVFDIAGTTDKSVKVNRFVMCMQNSCADLVVSMVGLPRW